MSQLGELRRLLFEQEQDTLNELQGRMRDPDVRASDVAEVLPAAIRQSAADDGRLVGALRDPVEQCIRDSIDSSPESFADSLFPVMGPAIRKAVAESIRGFVARINTTVEQSVSWRGLRWRFESARTGVPLSDIIVRDTLLYDTEQLFVIHRPSGLLVAHCSAPHRDSGENSDAVSAMLTAIQDFVRDSFGAGETTDLDTVQIGGRTVWIYYGPHAMLAGVFSGNPPNELRSHFHEANEDIHRRFGAEIAVFDGDREKFRELEVLLEPLLTSASIDTAGGDKRSFKPVIIAAIVVTLPFLVWFVLEQVHRSKVIDYIAALEAVPGVLVVDSGVRDGQTRIRVLRDPLAQIPAGLTADFGLQADDILLVEESIMSADPRLVLQRARTLLQAPASVAFEWRDEVLVARGTAPRVWLDRARNLDLQWTGANKADFSEVVVSEDVLLADLRKRYEVPASVDLKVIGDRVEARGVAPVQWLLKMHHLAASEADGIAISFGQVSIDLVSLADYFKRSVAPGDAFAYEFDEDRLAIYGSAAKSTFLQISEIITTLGLLDSVDISRLSVVDADELDTLARKYANFIVYFSGNTTLLDASAKDLSALRNDLPRLLSLADGLARSVRVKITGYSDTSGSSAMNESLRESRARFLRDIVIELGVPTTRVIAATAETPAEEGQDRSWRRAVMQIEIDPAS